MQAKRPSPVTFTITCHAKVRIIIGSFDGPIITAGTADRLYLKECRFQTIPVKP
jgi:hypothetical protein